MAEPTRGEWAVRPRGSAGFDVYSPGDGFLIATVNPRPLLQETRANAALIAAAPKLLRGLRDTLRWVEKIARCNLPDVEIPEFALERATVAEAEGERVP